MRDCRDPGVPCHRIIAAGGGLGGYGSSLQVKRELLRAEGLEVGMARVRRFADVRWTGGAKAAKTTHTAQGERPQRAPAQAQPLATARAARTKRATPSRRNATMTCRPRHQRRDR
jgi:hypothetical protein